MLTVCTQSVLTVRTDGLYSVCSQFLRSLCPTESGYKCLVLNVPLFKRINTNEAGGKVDAFSATVPNPLLLLPYYNLNYTIYSVFRRREDIGQRADTLFTSDQAGVANGVNKEAKNFVKNCVAYLSRRHRHLFRKQQ